MIVFLRGGLGNQMFQYSFAKYTQIKGKSEDKIFFNLALMKREKDNRHFSLNHFALAKKTAVLSPICGKAYVILFLIKMFFINPKAGLKHHTIGNPYIKDKECLEYSKKGLLLQTESIYHENILNYTAKRKYVFGFWQNKNYVLPILDILREDFCFQSELPERCFDISQKILNEESCCVHIRRGDYLNPRYKFFDVCNYEYFKKSIEILREKIPNVQFYIFSNSHVDIEWIKNNYEFGKNIHYVDFENDDYEELHLMTLCKHFIISNSTFSWWAAVLSDKAEKNGEKKVVIAPKPFSKRDNYSDYRGLYVDDWIILDAGR